MILCKLNWYLKAAIFPQKSFPSPFLPARILITIELIRKLTISFLAKVTIIWILFSHKQPMEESKLNNTRIHIEEQKPVVANL